MSPRRDGTLMYGTADKKTASILRDGLERNGWVFDKFEAMKNGRIRYHATRTPEKAGLAKTVIIESEIYQAWKLNNPGKAHLHRWGRKLRAARLEEAHGFYGFEGDGKPPFDNQDLEGCAVRECSECGSTEVTRL